MCEKCCFDDVEDQRRIGREKFGVFTALCCAHATAQLWREQVLGAAAPAADQTAVSWIEGGR